MGILINLISVVLLCLGGLLGFFLGFKKAIIKLSIFLFLVIIGFWISKPLSKFILSFSFASISNFLKSFLGKYISNAIIDKSYYLNLLIKNISIAVLRVIIFIIWVILSLLSTNLILLLFNKKIKKDKVQKTSLRIWGGAIGIFQVVVFIFTLSSPLAGIKFFLEKTNLSSFDAFPLRTSGYIIFDNLFSIKYQNREINLRHDFEVLVENEKIIKEDFNPKEVVQILFDLESIEIIGASFIEVLLLYKNKQEPLTFEMIRAIDKISYYNELEQIELLLDYTYLLEDVSLTYYSQLDSNVIINLVEILEKMKLIDLLLPSYLEDIENKLDFNLYGIYLDELDLEDIIWTKEIAVWKEVYQCFLNMGFTYYNQNLDFKGINPNDIKDLSRCLSSSQILELNPKQILKILMDNFLLREYELDFKKITSENLEEILLFVKLLGENNFFTKKFSSTEFLTDENVEETINILLGSEFCRKNLKTILLLMFEEKKTSFPLTVFELPSDVDWTKEEGEIELRSLFYLVRIFSTRRNDKNLVLKNIDKITNSQMYTKIIYQNLSQIIVHLKNQYLGQDFEVIDNVIWDSDEGKREFFILLDIYYHLVESKFIYQAKNLENYLNINDDVLYYLAKDLAASKLVVKNCNQFIQRVALKYDLNFLAMSLEEENWTEEEFYLILSSLKILGEMEDFVEVFSLSKEDIDNILSSKFFSHSLINYLYILETDFLVINLEKEDSLWFPECDDDGELRKFVYGLKLLIEKNNNNFTSLDTNIIRKITTGFKDEASDDLSIILSSQILSDSIKHNILKLKKNPNTQEGFLVIDIYEEDWLDGPSPYYRPGEIRNLIRALQLLFPDGDIFNLSFDQELISSISDGTVDTNGDGYLDENDDNDLRDILRSKIVSDTIIFLAIDILK